MIELNEYDQFYRTVANPLNKTRIDHFVADLDKLVDCCEEEVECQKNGEQSVRYNRDYVSIVDFINMIEEKPEWQPILKDVDSPFLKILRLDDAFFNKRVICQQNNNWEKARNVISATKALRKSTRAST